jgi:hypothetical protein
LKKISSNIISAFKILVVAYPPLNKRKYSNYFLELQARSIHISLPSIPATPSTAYPFSTLPILPHLLSLTLAVYNSAENS